jgi:hypothetical protein
MDNNITDTLDLSIDHMIEDLITRIKTDSSDKIKEDTEFSVRAFYNLMCNLIQIKINLEIENFCKTNSDLSALEHKFNITQEIAAVVFTQHFENYKNFISNPHERTEICLLREGAVQILNTIYNKPICESLKIESNPEGYKDVITSNDNTITVFADAKKVVVKTRKIDTFPTDLLTFSHDKGIFPSDEETLEYL